MHADALISRCGTYRYWLTRTWAAVCPPSERLVYVMLNPSTADASVDDPTIRRCVGFAKGAGFGGLVVVNLFALRATDPGQLETFPGDVVGPGNDEHILASAMAYGRVCVAWGDYPYPSVRPVVRQRPHAVILMLRAASIDVFALALTKKGYPRHPLYLKGDSTLMPYPPKESAHALPNV
jgi:hypothetical protein